MQALCHHEVHGGAPRDCVADIALRDGTNRPEAKTQQYAVSLVETFSTHRERIDELISGCLTEWSLSRLGSVERNVSRVAVAELLLGKAPEKVVLDEAVEIAKTFSSPKAGSLVNGVLDAVFRQVREDAEQADRPD